MNVVEHLSFIKIPVEIRRKFMLGCRDLNRKASHLVNYPHDVLILKVNKSPVYLPVSATYIYAYTGMQGRGYTVLLQD
jgi:hypothetical protein